MPLSVDKGIIGEHAYVYGPQTGRGAFSVGLSMAYLHVLLHSYRVVCRHQ